MAESSKETEQKIAQLQMLEQSLSNLLVQKQKFQGQLLETESALNELQTTEEAYKIVGNIMVASKKEDLQKELRDKQEMLKLRVSTLEKQENNIKDKSVKTRSEVMKTMEEK